MTGKLQPKRASARTKERFPDFPPRDDMQNFLHLNRPGHPVALEHHWGFSDSIIVLSEAPLRWAPHQREGHRIPDLLVAFDVDRALAVEQMGYSIRDQGKPPDFVLEIASPTTGRDDYTDKRADYAAFGVPEYWRFDASGGRYHDAPLAGDQLVDGAYRPVEIIRTDETHLWGYCAVLGLSLCWEEGQLRWWDSATRLYLETHDEVAEGRTVEREGRVAAESRAEGEREGRLRAESRVRELEEELRRFRQS